MVFGLAAVMAAAVTGLVCWQIVAVKRGRIAAAVYEDVLRGGAGAVLVDRDGNPKRAGSSKKRRRKKPDRDSA